MNGFGGLLLLALPTLLIVGVHVMMRNRVKLAQSVKWLIVAACWAVALWFWIDYNRQTDDVGLMVSGILAGATSVAALAATIAAVLTARMRPPQ